MEENVQETENIEIGQEIKQPDVETSETNVETTETNVEPTETNVETTGTETTGETPSQETETTTQEITETETNVPSISNTTSNNPLPATSSNTSAISDAEATSPNTRTNTAQELKIASDGSITIDGKPATNEQLEDYFDYTKYSDKNAAKMVEGLLKSDTVTINGVAYKAELNENGEMVSTDGTRRLTQEEIKGYFGEKGYEALVCKTTKDVTVDEDGKIRIKDREEQIKLKIADPVVNTNTSNTSNTATKDNKKTNTDNIKSPSGGSSSGGGGGYSGGGGGYSGGGGSSGGGGLTSGGADSPSEEEVEDPGTPVIMVEFGQLEAIRDELQTLKGQLSGVCDDYGTTITGLSGNGSAWSGSDKDAYVSQKKGYVTNIGQVSSTLDSFVGYLDTCVNNYKELEAKLAAKQIS